MRAFTTPFLILFLLLQTGCASNQALYSSEKEAIDNVATPFAEGGIVLELLSVPLLNPLNGMANSCTLLVLQAAKAETLSKLLTNSAKIRKMFNEATSDQGILKVDRYSAMPGQHTTLHIDRNQQARYVAVVAGYYPFPKQQQMILVGIPIKAKRYGFWRYHWQAKIQPLMMQIQLGSLSLSQYGIQQPVLPMMSEDGVSSAVPASSRQGE